MLQLKQPGSGKKFLAKTSFSDVLTNAVDSNFQILRTGSGQTVNQSGGNLLLAMGTTVNEETIIRSVDTYQSPMTLRYGLTLSQRIVNNNIFVELVDSVADNAAFNITSTTTVVVNVPATSMVNLSAKNIGQSMYISQLSGTGFAPQRAVIASVDTLANTITFTVTGFPASGTGQCYLYGWNTYRILYDGAVATTWKFDTQRNGWNSGDSSLTCNTTAAPGHSGIMDTLDGQTVLLDELLASGATVTQRGRRAVATPDGSVPLYIQLRVQNGTVAPASTTTATFAFITLEDYNPSNVIIEGVRPQSNSAAMPVSVINASVLAVQGWAADNSSTATSPINTAGLARAANPPAYTALNTARTFADLVGRSVVQIGGIPQLQDFNRVVLTTITETTLIAAVAVVRHGIHGLEIANRDNVAHTLDFRDTTAGTIRKTIVIPAGVTYPLAFNYGIWQLAVNTNWTVTMREAATTAVEVCSTSYRLSY